MKKEWWKTTIITDVFFATFSTALWTRRVMSNVNVRRRSTRPRWATLMADEWTGLVAATCQVVLSS